MSLLIYWQDAATGALASIRLDAVTGETPEDTLDITDHPVEQGANVVDHAREQPTRLSVEGIVSSIANLAVDTDSGLQVFDISVPARRVQGNGTQTIDLNPPKPPITPSIGGLIDAGISALFSAQMRGQFAADTSPITISAQAKGIQQNSPRNRVRDVYDALLLAQSQRQLVTINARDREFPDMMIERVAKPRSLDNGSSSQFQIDFKRIRVSASQTVAAPKPAEARGKVGTNKGSQAAKPKDDAAPAIESTLSMLTPG